MEILKTEKIASAGTAVLSAVSLKLCCWGPLFLTGVVGISGSSVYFSWLEALKPYLLALAFLSLAFSFYQVYKPAKQKQCDGNCETKKTSFFKSKFYVWLVAGFVVVITLVSYFPEMLRPGTETHFVIADKPGLQTVSLGIEGMSCKACEENISLALGRLDGVVSTQTSHQTGLAEIEFDNTKTSIEEIKSCIRARGYGIRNQGAVQLIP